MHIQDSQSTSRPSHRSTWEHLRTSVAVGTILLANSSAWAFQSPSSTGTTRAGGSAPSGGGSAPLSAPEINPALIVGAVVLLVGGLLILTSRRRRPAKS